MSRLNRPSLSIFLTVLMMSSLASAGISSWNGPSSLAGTNRVVDDAFLVPGNATVIDAWLHTDESGYLQDGEGMTWTGEDAPGNFSAGQFSDTLIGKFDGAMSLSPDSSVSNIQTFSSASLQLPLGWIQAGGLWEAVNPTSMGGTVAGNTRTLAHGYVPAAAYGGGVVAGTLPGQGLPASSSGTLTAPAFNLPSPINHFNLTFQHWHHLDVDDGAWVEYKLDNGNWNYLEPVGGYPDVISNSAPMPNGVNSIGFGVFGDGNHSGWTQAVFNLDNLTGISSATTMQFRFKVWTAANSTARPGWFLDEFDVENVGNAVGFWHHGCYVQTGTCTYSNYAAGQLTTDIDLSNTTTGSQVHTRLEWDLEGSSYDNFCVELSKDNGQTWTDISSNSGGSTTSGCRLRTGAIPGSGYTMPNGTFLSDESGGFVLLELDIPTAFIGVNSSLIKFWVETDSSVQYGGSTDSKEGLTLDWFKVVDSSGTNLSYDALDNTTSITTSLGPGGTNNDWSFILIGAGGLSISDGLEDAPALPPGGWSIQNVAGQTGWEFGAICTNYTDGPSGFPSANLGFGTNLCGDYDASSDNSLISPSYSVPLGASARFVWKHWMCSEDGWDGGALHISVNGGTWSQAYVNLGNNTTWYDGSIVYGPFVGTDVWDGRHHVAASGQWGCTSSANIPWVDMAYDVSSYSGNNVSFKFQQMSDTAVQEPGWYVDDIGLEVDWFESDGTWMSPLIPTNDLGYAFVDADVVLPNGTWYGVNVLDATGQVIAGHENLSLPLSLASIDRDQHQGVFIEMMLGTEDPYFTPLVRELTVGATRYFGDSNGWNVPSVIQRNSNGSWVNTAGNTQVITGDSGLSTRPISSAMVTGNFSQVTASLLKSGTQSVSATTTNSILDLDGMRNHVSPKVTLAPGAVIDTLAFRGTFALPAHDAAIDLANDGTDDWVFPANPSYGSLGWQTRIDDTAISHSESFTGSDTMSVLIPEDAIPRSLLIGITTNGASSPITLSSGSNSLQSVQTANWSSAVLSVENPQLVASSTHVDSFGRNWSMIDIDFSTSSTMSYTVGSFSIGYTLFENTSGLGQVVKTYHEANSNNGLEPTVEVPLTWSATAGGAMVTGGVHHENMITNYPFTVPETWYPNGMLQGFISQHRHLIDNDLIDEIHLIGQDSSGDSVGVILSDITNGGTFTQSSGFGMLKLSNTSSVSELNGRLTVDWQFDVDWDWNDSTSMSWTAQGFDADGEGLSPATALSGGIGTQASENDLQVDTWQVVDLYGHTLSDMFSPSYPFWAKSGTQVSVSGTVRFENTLDMRPLQDDFVVAVNVAGTDSILSSTGDGIWTGLVDLPMNMSEINMTPYVLRVGPIAGADGAEDVTLQTPVRVLLDDESPRVSNLQVNNGQRLLAADGYTWDPASSLSLQVTISDQQALGDELVLHTWREGADDANSNGVADPSEYQMRSESLPEGIAGDRTVTFSGIDVSGLEMNAQLSIYFTATDYSGHELVDGGSPGIDNDMATMVIAVNEPTEIPTSGLSLDTIDDMLMVGQTHTLSMEISDLNGVDSIDVVTVKMLGADEDTVGVMTWEPRNGAMYTPEGSMLTLHGVQTTDMGDYFLVEWDFTLDWDFDDSLLSEYSLPGIVVFDDDDLNPVELMTNLGEIRWQLDNDLEVVVENMSDNTPPISMNSAEHIYVQPGDDLTVTGMVRFAGTKAPITQLPPQGLEVQVSTDYGSVLVSEAAEVSSDGTWTTGMLLPNRALLDPLLIVEYAITGVISPGEDVTSVSTQITVDDTAPVVQFASVPLQLDDSDLPSLPFALTITEEGGMPEGELTVNWIFIRNGLAIENGEGTGLIPLTSNYQGSWSYAGNLDFITDTNVSLEQGDELIWWIDVVDLAGNQAVGTGLSLYDAMNTDFTVLSFDVTVTNIEIALADGSTPKGNQIVEGTEISVTVHVRNLGTKTGTVKVELFEDLGGGRNWLSHGYSEVSLSPGQSLPAVPLYFETHGAGSQNLHVNITEIDSWVNNAMLPHCNDITGTATCDLDVETDMPTVIGQDEANSGFSGYTLLIVILGILLLGAGFAIVVLLRRDSDETSMYYDDDDDDWEDEVDEVEAKVQPIYHLPIAPPRPDMDAAEKLLSSESEAESDDEQDDEQSDSEPEDEPVVADDPWGEVEHTTYSHSEEE